MLKIADDIEYQWCAGEVCFDCPCGEKEIIISEGGEHTLCKCGRIYKLVHYVAIVALQWEQLHIENIAVEDAVKGGRR